MLPHLKELKNKDQEEEPFVSVEREMAKSFSHTHADPSQALDYPENTSLPTKIKEIPVDEPKSSDSEAE